MQASQTCDANAGDEFEVRTYERLLPLVPLPDALESLRRVRRGDCVVAFSRRDVHAAKRAIDSHGALKCCMVYGALPAEARVSRGCMPVPMPTCWLSLGQAGGCLPGAMPCMACTVHACVGTRADPASVTPMHAARATWSEGPVPHPRADAEVLPVPRSCVSMRCGAGADRTSAAGRVRPAAAWGDILCGCGCLYRHAHSRPACSTDRAPASMCSLPVTPLAWA